MSSSMNHIQSCRFWKYCAEESATKLYSRWDFSPCNTLCYFWNLHQLKLCRITPTICVKIARFECEDAIQHMYCWYCGVLYLKHCVSASDSSPRNDISNLSKPCWECGSHWLIPRSPLAECFCCMEETCCMSPCFCFYHKHLLKTPFFTK